MASACRVLERLGGGQCLVKFLGRPTRKRFDHALGPPLRYGEADGLTLFPRFTGSLVILLSPTLRFGVRPGINL